MQTIHSREANTYSYILSEDEWYSGTDQQRQAWINQIMREGSEAQSRHLTILVKPDAVMSLSPTDKQHKVWGYSFPGGAETSLHRELMSVCATYVGKGAGKLTYAQARAIAKKVFEL